MQTEGLKLDQIRPCDVCGKGLLEDGLMPCRVRIERFVPDVAGINALSGLTTTLGGNLAIAQALAPKDELLKKFDEIDLFVCPRCSMNPNLSLPALIDRGLRSREIPDPVVHRDLGDEH